MTNALNDLRLIYIIRVREFPDENLFHCRLMLEEFESQIVTKNYGLEGVGEVGGFRSG